MGICTVLKHNKISCVKGCPLDSLYSITILFKRVPLFVYQGEWVLVATGPPVSLFLSLLCLIEQANFTLIIIIIF